MASSCYHHNVRLDRPLVVVELREHDLLPVHDHFELLILLTLPNLLCLHIWVVVLLDPSNEFHGRREHVGEFEHDEILPLDVEFEHY